MIAALFNPMTLLLATICLQWASLPAGPLSIQPPYLMMGVIMLYMMTNRYRLRAFWALLRNNAVWIVPFVVYLVILTVVLYDSPGQNIAPRQMFYLIGSIAFAACLAVTPRLAAIFRVGAIAGLVILTVAVEVLAQRVGLSWLDAIQAFARGDFNFVIYDFFRAVFNALDPTADVTLVASTKNEVAVGVLVLGLLLRAGNNKSDRDLIGLAGMGFVLFLLLLLNTRSVVIAAGASLIVAFILGAIIKPIDNVPILALKSLALVAAVVLAIGSSVPDDGASSSLGDRFAFQDASAGARVDQFNISLVEIEKHPFVGNGYFELDGHPIHNLFLSSWVHAGAAAFALVVIFYLGVLLQWIVFVSNLVARRDRWVLPIAPEWVATLPIMGLFRVWLSGDAGHLFLGEWVALSAFIGCVLANALAAQRRASIAAAYARRRVSEPLPA